MAKAWSTLAKRRHKPNNQTGGINKTLVNRRADDVHFLLEVVVIVRLTVDIV